MNSDKIFTQADYKALKDTQRSLHDLLPIIDKMESCGIECQAYREVMESLTERARLLDEHFFKGFRESPRV